jgi:hypothetical protein
MRAAGFALLCSLDYEICPEYLVLEASDLHHPKLQAGIHKSPLSLSLLDLDLENPQSISKER